MAVQYKPDQYHNVTPYLVVDGAAKVLDFVKQVFGAEELFRMDAPGGLVGHAEFKIGDSIVMLSDELEMPGAPNTRKTPKNAGATTGGVMLYVKDVDGFFERAVGAGAKSVMPPADQFWGDRYGQIEDPYGHVWALATHLRDMTPKELQKAMAQAGAPEA